MLIQFQSHGGLMKYIIAISILCPIHSFAKANCKKIQDYQLALLEHGKNFFHATTIKAKQKERSAFSFYATSLKVLAEKCHKKAKVAIDNGPVSFSVAYKFGAIKGEVFNFNSNKEIVSWVRTTLDGTSTLLNF